MVELRSNFKPGSTEWAVRRAQWRAMGIEEGDFEKPKVAVVYSSSQLSVCYSHLDELSDLVSQELRGAGVLPFEIRTVAPSDFVTSAGRSARYLMPSRDLLVNDVEVAVEGALLDGMICLASCDKTTPGQLMAAARLNLPTTIAIGGYQEAGKCGETLRDIDDVYEAVGTVAAGRMSIAELAEMADNAIDGPGVCAGLGTANSMHILAEALGMTVKGSAPIRAGSPEMQLRAKEAARCLVDMINAGTRPRDILTAEAIENAVIVAIAVGASVNTARHLQAVAVEAELEVDVYKLIEQHAQHVPMISTVRPNGSHRIEELARAGGALTVMKHLETLLHTDALTVGGLTLGERLADVDLDLTDVIRTLDSVRGTAPGLALFRGSLAPLGAVVKTGALPGGVHYIRGPAKVFEREEDAIDAIRDRRIVPGDVAVLRGLGVKGGPGTAFAAGFVAALNGAGLGSTVACVTDGELSGLNRGITIGQIMPEAAEGGPLALVAEGDEIEIDVSGRVVNLLVDDDVIARRQRDWVPPDPPTERSWLTFYWLLVDSLSRGGALRTFRET